MTTRATQAEAMAAYQIYLQASADVDSGGISSAEWVEAVRTFSIVLGIEDETAEKLRAMIDGVESQEAGVNGSTIAPVAHRRPVEVQLAAPTDMDRMMNTLGPLLRSEGATIAFNGGRPSSPDSTPYDRDCIDCRDAMRASILDSNIDPRHEPWHKA